MAASAGTGTTTGPYPGAGVGLGVSIVGLDGLGDGGLHGFSDGETGASAGDDREADGIVGPVEGPGADGIAALHAATMRMSEAAARRRAERRAGEGSMVVAEWRVVGPHDRRGR